MIINNNFNSKSTDPLNDYSGIGKGSYSLDKEFAREKEGFIKENMDNKVLQELRGENSDNEDLKYEDEWKLFR